MGIIYVPTPEQTAEDAAKQAAEERERKRPLSWAELKTREKTLPKHERGGDILRLDLGTVPEDVRGIFACLQDGARRGCR